jgi:magnesium transporter
MLYLSSLLGRPVIDGANRPVGRVQDLVARLGSDYPPVVGLRVRTGRRHHLDVSWFDVLSIETQQVILRRATADLEHVKLGETDILLARHVMDKQIVDLEGRRLIRAQDVQLSRAGSWLRVLGVDVSASALLRRLRLSGLADRIAVRRPPDSVAWSDVDVGSWRDPNLRLRVARARLTRLHPADLAEIASGMPASEGADLLESLGDTVAADTLEEMSPEARIRTLHELDPEMAARFVGEMSPDAAADLLQDLPDETAEVLLAGMDPEEAAAVRPLLGYEERSAGGLMTSEYLAVSPEETAESVLKRLQAGGPEQEPSFHLYAVDTDGRLVGEISLWELVVNPPDSTVRSFMFENPPTVETGAGMDEVVEAITKYNLMSLPVIDEAGRQLGVITVDDVIDLIGPQGWRPDPRRFLR